MAEQKETGDEPLSQMENESQETSSSEENQESDLVNGHASEDVELDGMCGFGIITLPGKGYKIVPLEGRLEGDNYIPYHFERDPNDDDVLMCVTYMHEFLSRQLLATTIVAMLSQVQAQQKIVTPKKGFRIR